MKNQEFAQKTLTEEQSLELFELIADAQEAKSAYDQLWKQVNELREKADELRSIACKKECMVDRFKEQILLADCTYQYDEKYAVEHEVYDQIKISYTDAYAGNRLAVGFKGRRKATKGWEQKTQKLHPTELDKIVICKL